MCHGPPSGTSGLEAPRSYSPKPLCCCPQPLALPFSSLASLFHERGRPGHLQAASLPDAACSVGLMLNTWSAGWAAAPHGLSQRPLVPSHEPAGNFPVWWLVQLTSRGQERLFSHPHEPLQEDPKETGPAGGSSGWWLEGTSGPQRLRHCLWLQPSLEALPSEPQLSSESVAECKQLDLCSQRTLALVPAPPAH